MPAVAYDLGPFWDEGRPAVELRRPGHARRPSGEGGRGGSLAGLSIRPRSLRGGAAGDTQGAAMTSAELLLDAFGRIRQVVHRVVAGLTPEQLAFRAV